MDFGAPQGIYGASRAHRSFRFFDTALNSLRFYEHRPTAREKRFDKTGEASPRLVEDEGARADCVLRQHGATHLQKTI
jgi:hypothetical protein